MTVNLCEYLPETELKVNDGASADRILSVNYQQGMRTVLLMDAFEHSTDGLHPTYDRLVLHGVFRLNGVERGLVIVRKPYFMAWCGEGITLSGLLRKVGNRDFLAHTDLPEQISALGAGGMPVLLRAQNSRNREGHGRRFGETSPYLLVALTKE